MGSNNESGQPERESHQQLFEFPDEHPATPISEISDNTRQEIQRIRPPVKAHGGKYYLAKQIVPILLSAPGNPTEYLEPCAFGASVFLALPRVEREILGDINPDVVNLWRVLSHEQYSAVLSEKLLSIPYEHRCLKNRRRKHPYRLLIKPFVS